MPPTVTKPSRGSRPPRPLRCCQGGYSRTGRDHKPQPSEVIRSNSISHNRYGAFDEEGKPVGATSPSSAFASGAKATAPVLVALIPFAMAFGATATANGLSALEALAMSVFVLAGAAQLAMIQLIATGASVAVIVLSVLTINLRLTIYSASLAPHFRRLPAGWKGLLSYLLTDPAYATTITRFDEGETKEPDKRWYFLGVGLGIWITWQVGTLMGVFLGPWVPENSSLDFVLPLTFIALAVPAIKERTTAVAALSAGVAAIFAAAMPLNLGLITAALVGVVGGLLAEGAARRRQR